MCWPIRGAAMLTVDPWGSLVVRVCPSHHDNQPGTDNKAKQRLISVRLPMRNYCVKLYSNYHFMFIVDKYRLWWLGVINSLSILWHSLQTVMTVLQPVWCVVCCQSDVWHVTIVMQCHEYVTWPVMTPPDQLRDNISSSKQSQTSSKDTKDNGKD